MESERVAVECYFCHRRIDGVEAAIEEGWIPSFWDAGDEYETPEPVCPGCIDTHLEPADDGEFVRADD